MPDQNAIEWAHALITHDLDPASTHLVDGGEGGDPIAAFQIALGPGLELDPRAVEEMTDILRDGLRFIGES